MKDVQTLLPYSNILKRRGFIKKKYLNTAPLNVSLVSGRLIYERRN